MTSRENATVLVSYKATKIYFCLGIRFIVPLDFAHHKAALKGVNVTRTVPRSIDKLHRAGVLSAIHLH